MKDLTPALSVVVPLIDDRGLAETALASWTSQTLESGTFEIVAVAGVSPSGLGEGARSLLRSHDRLLDVEGGGEMDLYQAGAEAARSDVLLFTEAHCVAEPGTVESVVRHFRESSADATILGGVPLASNATARFETRLFEEGIRDHPTDAWRRVALRGFAVRREAWVEAGGFETACGRLAESILAVRLERLGRRIDACPAARIHHGNCSRLRDLAAALRPHGRGQAVWRERCEAGLEADFLPRLPDWSERARWEPRLARHASGLLLRTAARRIARGEWREGAEIARRLPAFLLGAILGTRFPRWIAAARAVCFLAASRLPRSEERRYRSYARASSELLRWGVFDHVAESGLPAAPTARCIRPAELPDGTLVGFHAAECWSVDRSDPGCRWTRPFALMRLDLAPADYRLSLQASVPLDPERFAWQLFFNGRRIPASPNGSFAVERGAFRAGEQLLAITCAPFHPAGLGLPDSRELGIALFGLRFEPVG